MINFLIIHGQRMKKCGNLCHVFKDDPVSKYRSKIAYDVIWEFPKQRSKSVDDHVSPTNIEHPRIHFGLHDSLT